MIYVVCVKIVFSPFDNIMKEISRSAKGGHGMPTLNAGVRLRIGLLGLLGVAGVLVLGAINLYGTNRQATYQASADQAVELRLLSVDLGDAVLEARRAEIEFL